MRELLRQTIQHLSAGQQVVWCVITSAEGSTPRGVGSKMAVFADGSLYGTVGGGAVEYQAVNFARSLGDKGIVRSYELYPGGAEATGMVCGGRVQIGFFPFQPQAVQVLKDALDRLSRPGDCWLTLRIEPSGAVGFSLNGRDALPGNPAPLAAPVCRTLPDGTVQLTEPISRDYMVYLFGAGHVSAALVPVLLPLGFPVTVIDPRQELVVPERFPGANLLCAGFDRLPSAVKITRRDYAVIMTPGHEKDLAVLRQVLRSPAFYIGCIGSRQKTAYVNQVLREEGFSEADISRIHAPIGLPILAKTPEEIAISIAAEMVLHRAGG